MSARLNAVPGRITRPGGVAVPARTATIFERRVESAGGEVARPRLAFFQ